MKYFNKRELYVCLIVTVPALFSGINAGFSTEYIEKLKSEKLTSSSDISLIGGSGVMLTSIGCLVGGYLMDALGRKSLFFFTFGIHFIGWMTVAKTPYFYIGRALISIAVGLGYGCMVYITEVLQPQHRGAFLSITGVFEIGGSLCVYVIEYYITAKKTALLLSITAFILFLGTLIIPESPYWYMMKKRKDKAIKSLLWLRSGKEITVQWEIQDMEKSLDDVNKEKKFVNVIFNLKWWKIFLFFSIYVVLSELTGFDIIIVYSVQFFETFNRTAIDSTKISFIFMIAALVGTIVTILIVEKYKRTSLVKCANIMNLFLLSVAAISETFFNPPIKSALSVICLIIYGTTVSIVAFVVPWTVISESLPTESRATEFAALNSEFAVVSFISTIYFPRILSCVSTNYIFLSFAVIALFNYFFVNYFIKDTRGTILSGNINT